MNGELAAFKSVDFDWTRHLHSVWDDECLACRRTHRRARR